MKTLIWQPIIIELSLIVFSKSYYGFTKVVHYKRKSVKTNLNAGKWSLGFFISVILWHPVKKLKDDSVMPLDMAFDLLNFDQAFRLNFSESKLAFC